MAWLCHLRTDAQAVISLRPKAGSETDGCHVHTLMCLTGLLTEWTCCAWKGRKQPQMLFFFPPGNRLTLTGRAANNGEWVHAFTQLLCQHLLQPKRGPFTEQVPRAGAVPVPTQCSSSCSLFLTLHTDSGHACLSAMQHKPFHTTCQSDSVV